MGPCCASEVGIPESASEHRLFWLEDSSKVYDGRTVLQIARLAIIRHEVLAVVGPSGSGKSTLLRLLNFLEPPSSGKIYVDNFPVSEDPPITLRRRVTMVFQHPKLLRRSVSDNVAYGLKVRGDYSVKSRVAEALKNVGLADMGSVQANMLSSGEKQRVALARALAFKPEVLLLDEPTANLDPYNVQLIEKLITKQHTTHGTTIVLVTHNVFQARRLAHRCALLLDGELVEVADTETFFESPLDSRVGAFVRGEMVY